ncbi:Dual specificity mitogen-activated protein kinase kinase 1 [Boothiomyces macroporosus]|uniref:mitogen-activated protein kinase kinase n=1 Tax=Boothiomyces macroporosus TaxID=261099 RepID=A0AAD5UG54_9FUNG|nr:Dual specificity mitogen-activated protein kinase kinase 1 [Boothiomyces macroporosus]
MGIESNLTIPTTPGSLRQKRHSAATIPLLPLFNQDDKPALPNHQDKFVITNEKYSFDENQLELVAYIGSGVTSTVYKVVHKPTKTVMARKRFSLPPTNENENLKEIESQILRELNILRLCQCVNIVGFYGSFISDNTISVMLEYVDLGSLESIYNRTGPIPEREISVIAFQILSAFIYLEEHHKIVHRDIKPANILLSSEGVIKLSDFGVSKETLKSAAKTFVGTFYYLAPERLQQGQQSTGTSDIWSFGLTVMEIAMARFPYPKELLQNQFDMLPYITEEPSPTLPKDTFSPEFEEFCGQCLIKDHLARPNAHTLMNTEFIKKCISNNYDLKDWIKTFNIVGSLSPKFTMGVFKRLLREDRKEKKPEKNGMYKDNFHSMGNLADPVGLSKLPKRISKSVDLEINTSIQSLQLNLSNVDISKDSLFEFDESKLQYISAIGNGSFASVTKVLYKPNGMFMARKDVIINALDGDTLEKTEMNIMRELNILRQCNCPYITSFYGAFLNGQKISMFLEYMDLGSLEYIYKVAGPVPEKEHSIILIKTKRLYIEVTLNLQDIKPANILLCSDGLAKLADFGLSKQTLLSPAKSVVGTLMYLAPEQMEQTDNNKKSTTKSDIWSLGLALMEVALARFPYETDWLYESDSKRKSLFDILPTIKNGPVPTLPKQAFSHDFVNFCSLCLTKDENERPPASKLLEDPFVKYQGKTPDLREWIKTLPAILRKNTKVLNINKT